MSAPINRRLDGQEEARQTKFKNASDAAAALAGNSEVKHNVERQMAYDMGFERGFLAAQRAAENIARERVSEPITRSYERQLGWKHCAENIATAILAMKIDEVKS